MERAALFKKKNYGKLNSDVSIVTESNQKRVVDILCSIFQDVLKRPTTEVSATRNNFLQSAKLKAVDEDKPFHDIRFEVKLKPSQTNFLRFFAADRFIIILVCSM